MNEEDKIAKLENTLESLLNEYHVDEIVNILAYVLALAGHDPDNLEWSSRISKLIEQDAQKK